MAPSHGNYPSESAPMHSSTWFTLSARSATGPSITASSSAELAAQFRNPVDILSVLLIIGGDIVQKALAQVSKTGPAPVCFSFGWVSYSFIALVNLLGDGRIMPTPDYRCTVINMENGYHRENKSWLIGRLMRDNEAFMTKKLKAKTNAGRALRIAIYDPSPHIPWNIMRPIHILVTCLQLGIAVIPWKLHADWVPFLVTATGTALATIMGMLPQWKAEKFPTTSSSNKTIAITAGNGTKDVILVRGTGHGLDLERLAAAEGPRGTRPWEQWGLFTRREGEDTHTKTLNGLPVDFWFTRLICTLLTLCWLTLLILVAGFKSNTWYLLLIGAMGMFQNALVAGISVNPEGQPISLLCKEIIHGNKVMDALMDLEVMLEQDTGLNKDGRFNIVKPLLNDFFPGELRKNEVKWWKGERQDYDNNRMEEYEKRGVPRSFWDTGKPRVQTRDSNKTEDQEALATSKSMVSIEDRRELTAPESYPTGLNAKDRHHQEADPEDMIHQISRGMV